ncbi:MAG: hypothetical protein HC933_03680 [Pleurocapsa sp. SU_196_0]|nr:hypothetical protein [Pleurocapsa sp. SU_196_0]
MNKKFMLMLVLVSSFAFAGLRPLEAVAASTSPGTTSVLMAAPIEPELGKLDKLWEWGTKGAEALGLVAAAEWVYDKVTNWIEGPKSNTQVLQPLTAESLD